MATLEFIKEAIDSFGLLANNGATIADGIGEMAIVVPLDVGNVVLG